MSRTYLAQVPVIPVLFALGRDSDQRGRYWCPFHNDDRPGGRPSAEVRDDPTILSCWSCETNATAAEIVARVRGVSLSEAQRWAVETAGHIAALPRRQRPRPSAARLEAELHRLTTGIRYPGDVDPLTSFLWSRPNVPVYPYVYNEWGWRGDYRGRVIIPHRDRAGALTGLKFRVPPDWAKESRPGSRFECLYGLWRLAGGSPLDRGESPGDDETGPAANVVRPVPEEIWLLEGETDTVWAASHLEPLGVTCLGLPGAGYKPTLEELELLRDRRVVMALDGDAAGERARDTWTRALDGVAAEIQVVDLLPGMDLCTLTMTPVELRERL